MIQNCRLLTSRNVKHSSIIRSRSSLLNFTKSNSSIVYTSKRYNSSVSNIDDTERKEIFRLNYRKSSFETEKINLLFNLGKEKTTVTSVSSMKVLNMEDLVLNGDIDVITIETISINDIDLNESEYKILKSKLIIDKDVLSRFELKIVNHLNPSKNLALSGLYCSDNMLCTQCEAMGFRRITYHLDRYSLYVPSALPY